MTGFLLAGFSFTGCFEAPVVYSLSPDTDTLDISFGDHVDFCYEFRKVFNIELHPVFTITNAATHGEMMTTNHLMKSLTENYSYCEKVYIDEILAGVNTIRVSMKINWNDEDIVAERTYVLK